MQGTGGGGHSATRDAGRPRPAVVLPLDLTPGHLLRRAQQVHTALWLAEFDREVTGPQFALLLAMTQNGPLDQNSVGQLVSLDKSTAADVIVRLQKYGWLDRTRDPSDARRNLLTLTRAARTAVRHLTAGVVAVQQRLVEPIAPARRHWFVEKLALLAYAGQVPAPRAARPAGERAEIAVPLRLEGAPGHLIRRAEQLHGSHWLTRVGPRLTPSQYGLLSAIASQHLLDQRDAGDRASLDKSSTSDIVGRLTRRGLIGREGDERDRRRKLLYLTDEAWQLMEEVEPAVRAVQAALVQPLPEDDAAELTELLRNVAYRR
ncbi:MarR family winged helix-turn-helix transcriptional regulator [Dactylosporangium sp. CA-092794]|uniref:MarR family winged helix-turn-helix transcriptional regulator n=1 Tax=Dactylosporangium sp. CA-092794 TaxID=3239929 RepID=UPI003D90BFAF